MAAVLLVLSATAAAAAGPPAPSPSPSPQAKNSSLRIALLAGEELPLLGLLEAGLMENIPASWVERNEIKKVLTEAELQAAFGADAPQRRTALGKILRADLLVLVRSAEDSQPHLEVVVCETRQGLRLSVQPIRLTAQPETAVAAVTRLLQQAIEKERQKIVDIVAVPPLMNMSLGREADYLQRAYAGLIEGCLLERPGVLVVELAEADAIAREIALSGGTIERRLPLYLLGQYRIETAAGQPAGQFTLKLLRGKRRWTAAARPRWCRSGWRRRSRGGPGDARQGPRPAGRAFRSGDRGPAIARRRGSIPGGRRLARGAEPGRGQPAVEPQSAAPAPRRRGDPRHDGERA